VLPHNVSAVAAITRAPDTKMPSSPPPHCPISSFMLAPADWGANRSSGAGKMTSTADRFKIPAYGPSTAIPAQGIARDIERGNGPNSGYSMRSRSPRIHVKRAADQTPITLRSTVNDALCSAGSSFRATSPRIPVTQALDQTPITLRSTCSDALCSAGASFRATSPRIPVKKALDQTPITLRSTVNDVVCSAGASFRGSTRTRFDSPTRGRSPVTTYLGPPNWGAAAAATGRSASFASSSPRIAHHKAYQGPQTAISPGRTLGMDKPNGGAAMRYSSPRFPPPRFVQ
jgi:hypothetical protein